MVKWRGLAFGFLWIVLLLLGANAVSAFGYGGGYYPYYYPYPYYDGLYYHPHYYDFYYHPIYYAPVYYRPVYRYYPDYQTYSLGGRSYYYSSGYSYRPYWTWDDGRRCNSLWSC